MRVTQGIYGNNVGLYVEVRDCVREWDFIKRSLIKHKSKLTLLHCTVSCFVFYASHTFYGRHFGIVTDKGL
jgi:hypothetical protein